CCFTEQARVGGHGQRQRRLVEFVLQQGREEPERDRFLALELEAQRQSREVDDAIPHRAGHSCLLQVADAQSNVVATNRDEHVSFRHLVDRHRHDDAALLRRRWKRKERQGCHRHAAPYSVQESNRAQITPTLSQKSTVAVTMSLYVPDATS